MLKRKIKSYIKEILLLMLTMSVVANLMSLYKSRDISETPLQQKEFRLVGNTLYRVPKNKPLLLHFWATWCPTCKLEADNIERLSHYYEVLTIVVKSGDDKSIQNYLREHNLHFRVVNDNSGIVAKTFGIPAYPTTFIYDTKGKVAFKEVGYTSTLGLWLRLLWAGA